MPISKSSLREIVRRLPLRVALLLVVIALLVSSFSPAYAAQATQPDVAYAAQAGLTATAPDPDQPDQPVSDEPDQPVSDEPDQPGLPVAPDPGQPDQSTPGPDSQQRPPLVVDRADLLTPYEEQQLTALLERLSIDNQCDIVVVTVNSSGGKTPMEFADDFYDDHNYGQGPDRTGILLLISMAERDWWVSTCGRAVNQLSEERLDDMMSFVLPPLSNGRYYEAFVEFGYQAEILMQMDEPWQSGPSDHPGWIDEPNQSGNNGYYNSYGGSGKSGLPANPIGWLVFFVTNIAVGLIIAVAACTALKAKHRSVRQSSGARNYVLSARSQALPVAGGSNNSFGDLIGGIMGSSNAASIAMTALQVIALTANTETLVSSNVSRVRKAEARDKSSGGGGGGSSSSGGFGSHTSSSGTTHGGGGGKFAVATDPATKARARSFTGSTKASGKAQSVRKSVSGSKSSSKAFKSPRSFAPKGRKF